MALETGIRARVYELAENPEEGVAHQVRIEVQPAPDPSTLGSRDVLIGVQSCGVSWVDLLMTSGQYQHMPPLPYTPGLEYSGRVLWVGADISADRLAPGAEVFVDCQSSGPRSPGPYQQYGGFASYAVAPLSAVHLIPAGFSFDQASNFAGNYETAYHCLVERGRLQAGETILIHGASGATGLAAVQIAKLLGATVIATGRRRDKLEVVQSYGADHILCLKRDDGQPGVRRFREDVKALTGGKGVDVVYDGVGGQISLESLRCVQFGARFLIVGWASTPLVAKGKGGRGAPNANQLPTNLIMMKGLQVLGCPMIISTQNDPSIRAPRMKQLLAWAEAGQICPHVSHVFDLKDASQAMMARWTGEIIGGCAVRCGGKPRG